MEVKAKKEEDDHEEVEKAFEDEIRKLRREILQMQADKDTKESKFNQVTFFKSLNDFVQ